MASVVQQLLLPFSGGIVGAVLGWSVLAPWARRNLRSAQWWAPARVAVLVAVAVAFGAICWRVGWGWALPATLVFAACGIAVSVVDLFEKRIPNRMLIVAAAVEVVAILVGVAGSRSALPLLWAVIGAASMFLFYLVIALAVPSAMGMGDVKLAALAGGLLGFVAPAAILLGAVAGVLIGGIAALVLVAVRRGAMGGSIPYGPALVLGGIAGALMAISPK